MRFKKHKKEGPYRSFQSDFTDIIDGGICGSIVEDRKGGDYVVRLVVKDGAEFAGWRWIQLKARFATETLAREFVKGRWEGLGTKFNIHALD